jgi:hypothetical protein
MITQAFLLTLRRYYRMTGSTLLAARLAPPTTVR